MKFSLSRLPGLVPRSSRPLVESALYGLVAGGAAVAFEVAVTVVFGATMVRFSQWGGWRFAEASLGVMVGTSLASGYLLHRFAPEAAGSGIPLAKLAFWKDFGFIPARILWVKFAAGVLAIGGGASLGREGPTVQLSAAAASNFSGWLGVAKTGRRRPTAAGAAAGLAAAFNTPLAAIAFVLEEVLGDLNSALLGSVVVAAVLGAFVVHALLGSNPAFVLPAVTMQTWRGQALVAPAALLAALIGVCFQFCALETRKRFRGAPIPEWMRPAAGVVGCWAIGSMIFIATGRLGIFGVGYGDLTAGLEGELAGLIPILLLLGKFAGTVLCYGSGGCGGIFAPSLFMGAMAGCAVGEGAAALGLPLAPEDQLLLEVVGMSASLAAVVRAPFASILIVFEMTREFSLVPALLVGGVISQALSRWMLPHGFYEQVLHDDGIALRTVMPPRDLREWQNYPVSAIANFQPVVLPGLGPEILRETLGAHAFAKFLYQPEGAAPVMVRREEMEAALGAGGREPAGQAIPVCLRADPISGVQEKLVESGHGLVAVLDREGGAVVGLLTLHDILRAQQNLVSQQEG